MLRSGRCCAPSTPATASPPLAACSQRFRPARASSKRTLRGDEGPGLDALGAVGFAAELLHRAQEAEPVQHLMLAAVLDLVGRVAVPGRVIARFQCLVEPSVGGD